jgi:actin related protein 2/3 complex subunit 4
MPQVHPIFDATCGELHRVAEKAHQGACMHHLTPYLALRDHGGQGYDISFLITNAQTETMMKHKIVDFIIQCVTP